MTAKEAYEIVQRDYDCDAHREVTDGSCSLDCVNCPNYIPLTVLEEARKREHEFVGEFFAKIQEVEVKKED